MPVDYEKRQHVAYVTINNPRKANILDRDISQQLSDAWIEVWQDRDVRAAVITGAGDRHFCAGHNLEALADLTPEDRERYTIERLVWPAAGTVNGSRIGADGRMGDHFPQIWKPVVAAVNGWAAGAGFYLLLSSTDIRIASDTSRYLLAMTSRGSVGAGPGATLLMRQVRYADAMRILLMDEPVSADEALRIGLVNEVVPHGELMARAEEVADTPRRHAAGRGPHDERVRHPIPRCAYRRRMAGAAPHEFVRDRHNNRRRRGEGSVRIEARRRIHRRPETRGASRSPTWTKRTAKTSTTYSAPRAYPAHDRLLSGPCLHVTLSEAEGPGAGSPRSLTEDNAPTSHS